MNQPTEDDLIRLAKALGEATTKCTDEERAHIKRLYEDVQKFGDEQKEKEIYIDRSAFFAAGIILHEHIENVDVRKAATDYVEMDHLFIKSQEEISDADAPTACDAKTTECDAKAAPPETAAP